MANVEDRAAGREAWQSLRSNPDYRAGWKAHAGAAPVLEPAPFPMRVQSEADLMALRWGLLAWEVAGGLRHPFERGSHRRHVGEEFHPVDAETGKVW